MIDTVILRLHHLVKFQEVVETIRKMENAILRGNPVFKNKGESLYFNMKVYKYNDTGKEKLTVNGKFNIKSSSYYVTFIMDEPRDFIEFNMSIPKILYGTNILQFIPHKDINRGFQESYKMIDNVVTVYEMLYEFIVNFFQNVLHLTDTKTYLLYLQIVRIDFCYNLIFDSKYDSFSYLNMLKNLVPKGKRKENSRFRYNYDTGFYYVTSRYTFKIYHKGSEFVKTGNRKYLEGVNAMKGQQKYDIEYLQDLSDRTLRFELEFKSAYMSQLYKEKVYRKDCVYWKDVKNDYKYVRRKTRMNVDNYYKLRYDLYSNALSHRNEFYYAVPEDVKWSEMYFEDYEMSAEEIRKYTYDKQASFNFDLFAEMFKVFRKKMKEFHIENNSNVELFDDRLEVYKITYAKNLNKTSLKAFLKLLMNMGEYDLKNSGIYPKSTYYKYMKAIKKMGIEFRNVKSEQFAVSFDYKRYNFEIIENMHKLQSLKNIIFINY